MPKRLAKRISSLPWNETELPLDAAKTFSKNWENSKMQHMNQRAMLLKKQPGQCSKLNRILKKRFTLNSAEIHPSMHAMLNLKFH